MSNRNTRPPNYYKILNIAEDATVQQVRTAYKRAALETHPDRVPADSPERDERKRKFQLVNDAYYTLSDDSRRMEYNVQRRMYGQTGGGGGEKSKTGNASTGGTTDSDFEDRFQEEDGDDEAAGGAGPTGNEFFSWAWEFFMKNANNAQRTQTEDRQWGDAFEEMYRDEDMENPEKKGNVWSILGGLAGGTLGFIAANVPGMVAGGVAGNRFGAIRDAKGKSVYAVYQELPQDARMAMLTQLAARVFSHAAGI